MGFAEPDRWAIVGVIVGMLALVLPLLRALRNDIIERLRLDPAYRQQLARSLVRSALSIHYFAGLEKGINWLNSNMGRRQDWVRGILWCFAIAFVYATSFLFLGWAWTGTATTFGGFDLLPDGRDQPIASRWFRISSILTAWASSIFLVMRLASIERWITRTITKTNIYLLTVAIVAVGIFSIGYFNDNNLMRSEMIICGIGIVTVVGLGVVASRSASIGAFAAVGLTAIVVTLACAFAAAFAKNQTIAFNVSVAVGWAAAVAVAIAYYLGVRISKVALVGVGVAIAAATGISLLGLLGLGEPGHAFSLILLVLVIPLVNSILDWLSWMISRWLAEDIAAAKQHGFRPKFFVLHVIVDIAAAFFLLAILAICLPRTIKLFAWLYSALIEFGPQAIDRFLCKSANDPLGQGLWATAMLLSTLLPTLLHMSFLFLLPYVSWLSSSTDDWKQRSTHLEVRGALPPETDLPENGHNRDLAVDQYPNEATIRKIANYKVIRWLYYFVSIVMASLVIYIIIRLIELAMGQAPSLLLYLATFDSNFVRHCFISV